jgi:hypothetical protein
MRIQSEESSIEKVYHVTHVSILINSRQFIRRIACMIPRFEMLLETVHDIRHGHIVNI